MGKIKWARVFANAGYTFFSVLVGSFSLGALLKMDIPLFYVLELSCTVAAFNAGLAFFAELKKETEEKPRTLRHAPATPETLTASSERLFGNPGTAPPEEQDPDPVSTTKKILSMILVW